jgi:hypothetical protein
MMMARQTFARSALADVIIEPDHDWRGCQCSRADTANKLTRLLRLAGVREIVISDKLVTNTYSVDEFVFYISEGLL